MRKTKIQIPNVGVFSFIALGLMASLIMFVPVDNIPAEKPANETVIEVPGVSGLFDSNVGLNSITFKWSNPPESVQIAIYKIYLNEILIDTIDGTSHIYTVTGLNPGNLYNFHVDACNSSGKCSNGGSVVGVRTLSVQQATEAIINDVEKLTSAGILNAAQEQSLIQNLAAIYQLDEMNAKLTITQLQVFKDNINSLIANGVLPRESGQTLIYATDDVIRNL